MYISMTCLIILQPFKLVCGFRQYTFLLVDYWKRYLITIVFIMNFKTVYCSPLLINFMHIITANYRHLRDMDFNIHMDNNHHIWYRTIAVAASWFVLSLSESMWQIYITWCVYIFLDFLVWKCECVVCGVGLYTCTYHLYVNVSMWLLCFGLSCARKMNMLHKLVCCVHVWDHISKTLIK